MKHIAMIPARYAATRFPYKLMQPLGSKTVIWHTYQNTVATGLFNDVFVITDHAIIYDHVIANGGKAIMSRQQHESGTDRIAEAVADMEFDVVVNVQGDEPFVAAQPLADMLKAFEQNQNVQVASLMKKLNDVALIQNPNYVKVVCNEHGNALYFSRSAIPFNRDGIDGVQHFEHIGVYAFTKNALKQFVSWPVATLEKIEKLEQLRYLANGVNIRMIETFTDTVKIDVPEDLPKAEAYLKGLN